MQVPLLDLKPQLASLEPEMTEGVLRVLRSTRYVGGPEVDALENEIAEYCGVGYGIGVSSGTDALLVSVMGLDLKPGDQVLTTPFSFFATMGVILRVGATPVFADIDPESFNIDPKSMEKILQADTERKIKAVIPVHLYGQCADMTPIVELAAQYGLPVIEDAAQAIGAEYPNFGGSGKNAKAGAMGLAGCFSFFPSKNLGGIGDSGMVVTPDEEFAEKLRLLRNHGAHPKYYHKMVGGNFRIDPIQAVALRIKLPHLNDWHRGRAANAATYNRMFAETGLIEAGLVKTPKEVYQGEGNLHIYNQFVLRVERRDELVAFLHAHDIGCEIYYPVPLHHQECLGDLAASADCPEADKAAREVTALPIYAELTDEMQQYVVDTIVKFYS